MLFDANRNKRESLRRGVAKAGPGRLACLVCSALVVVGARARVPKNSAHLARRSLKSTDHGDDHSANGAAYEWAGVFETSASSLTWLMQKVDGEYADPTMRLVLFKTNEPTAKTMESLESDAETMMMKADCPVREAGSSMAASNSGNCYELHVGTGEDSTYTISGWDSNGNDTVGLVIFAQHVPLEFERDTHYLRTADGADVEPVAEEGADGHGHGHGHDHGSDACKADECGKAFQTVLMVHDVCKESDFPNALEAQLHLHEESCAQHFCNTADGPFELKCEDHDHDHDHDHGDHAEEESCACVAEQQGWTIDCAKPAPVSAAATYLTDNNCKDNNTTDACEMNFHIIQSHHDFCGYDDIPAEAALLVHELDPYFTHCNVRRQHDQDMPQCPAVDCKDTSAMEAAVAKLASPACAAA